MLGWLAIDMRQVNNGKQYDKLTTRERVMLFWFSETGQAAKKEKTRCMQIWFSFAFFFPDSTAFLGVWGRDVSTSWHGKQTCALKQNLGNEKKGRNRRKKKVDECFLFPQIPGTNGDCRAGIGSARCAAAPVPGPGQGG